MTHRCGPRGMSSGRLAAQLRNFIAMCFILGERFRMVLAFRTCLNPLKFVLLAYNSASSFNSCAKAQQF